MPLQPPTTLTGRDQNTLASAPYTGEYKMLLVTKEGKSVVEVLVVVDYPFFMVTFIRSACTTY